MIEYAFGEPGRKADFALPHSTEAHEELAESHRAPRQRGRGYLGPPQSPRRDAGLRVPLQGAYA